MAEKVNLCLEVHEALVFFEWLSILDDNGLKIDDAEQQVIWHLTGQLESELTEVFSEDYHTLVSRAKKQVLEGNGGPHSTGS